MLDVLEGVTIDGVRLDRPPAAGIASGALGALGMAVLWCTVAHVTHGDASLPVRAVASSVLGGDVDDARLVAPAIMLGLAIHLGLGMWYGNALDRAALRRLGRSAPIGLSFAVTVAVGAVVSTLLLPRVAPDLVAAVPLVALVGAHAVLGAALELTRFIRGDRASDFAFEPSAPPPVQPLHEGSMYGAEVRRERGPAEEAFVEKAVGRRA
jgi:hypothetical protein